MPKPARSINSSAVAKSKSKVMWTPGMAATLAVVWSLLTLEDTGIHVANFSGILLLAVAFASIFGRVKAGLASAAIAIAYCAYILSIPANLFSYTRPHRAELISDTFLLLAMALIVSLLKRRNDLLVRERIHHIEEAAAERARADSTLRQFAELEAVIEGMPAGIYIGAQEGLSVCNRLGLEMFGYDSLEPLLNDFPAIFTVLNAVWNDTGMPLTDEDQPFACAMRGEHIVRDIRYRNRATNQEMVVRCASAPITVDGKIVAGVAVNTDITKRIRMEGELRENQESYRRLINTATEGIWICDPEGRTTFANEQMARMLGETVDAIVGRLVADYAHGDSREAIGGFIEQRRGGASALHDFQFRRASGSTIWAMVSGNAILDKNGGYVGVLAMVTDITERKLAQAKLEAIYGREHRIAETLQRSMLLTKSDLKFSGFDVDSFYQPALDEALVGGDFFDAFPLEQGLIAFAVGDASGKGLEAAAHTAEVKYTIRALLREHVSPAQALSRMNEIICERQRLEVGGFDGFVCLALVVANPVNGNMDIAIAGAEPPVIVRQNGTIEVLMAHGGMSLGILPRQVYEDGAYTLAAGDMLLITTDGITEAHQDKSFFGLEGFCRAIGNSHKAATLAELNRAVVASAKTFAGGKLHDDVCLLTIKKMAHERTSRLPNSGEVMFRPSPKLTSPPLEPDSKKPRDT